MVQNQERSKETGNKVFKNDGLRLFAVWLRAVTNLYVMQGALKNADESIIKSRWKESLVMWTKKKNVREENYLKKEVEWGGGVGRTAVVIVFDVVLDKRERV